MHSPEDDPDFEDTCEQLTRVAKTWYRLNLDFISLICVDLLAIVSVCTLMGLIAQFGRLILRNEPGRTQVENGSNRNLNPA